MAIVNAFFVLQAGVLRFWSLPAVERWFVRYLVAHPGSVDFGATRQRIAVEGPLAAPATYRYVAWFLRALTTPDDDLDAELMRRRAVRRMASYLGFLILGLPVLLWAASVFRATFGG